MLFEFNKVWKTLAIILATWGVFGAAGFEFTTVTLLAAIVGMQLTKK